MSNWVRVLNIKEEWKKANDFEISVQELSKVIYTRLENFSLKNDFTLQDIIEDFKRLAEDELSDFDEFNFVMQYLYDWADTPLDREWNGKKNCWIETN